MSLCNNTHYATSSYQLPARPAYSFFFFNDTATTEIYTLSLHDALPISREAMRKLARSNQHINQRQQFRQPFIDVVNIGGDRKSTRLNSSHLVISYAVFCLKKKKHHHEIYAHVGKILQYAEPDHNTAATH